MELTSRFEQALVYATRLHKTQLRKGTQIPYIAHLLSVTALVLENGGGENEAIAALLHDAVEDQGGKKTLADIRARFGDQVAEIVIGLSDSDSTPKPPWKERKQAYLTHLLTSSEPVILVSLADKLHNARSLLISYRAVGEAVWARFNGRKAGTLWYYQTLVENFKQITSGAMLEELEAIVIELGRVSSV